MEKNIILGCSKKMSNGVTIVNATPHDLTFLDGDTVVTVPCSVKEGEKTGPLVINARATEVPAGEHLVRTSFAGDETGEAIIAAINEALPGAFIIGSIIAAQAYPGKVVGMTPAPGFERVPPAEKRMSIEKFTTFA